MNVEKEKVLEVIGKIAERPVEDLKPEIELVSDLGIDSPKALQLLVELEDVIGVEITDEEAALLESVGDVLSLYEAK